MLRLLIAAALALPTINAIAQEVVPGDKVYYLHSSAWDNCPPLSWHIVASPDGVLAGVVVSDDKKLVVMLAGVINPLANVDRSTKAQRSAGAQTFRMLATKVGNQNRIADVNGVVEPNGWLNASVNGAGVACEHIRVPLFVPAKSP